jgi:hypothetical protein
LNAKIVIINAIRNNIFDNILTRQSIKVRLATMLTIVATTLTATFAHVGKNIETEQGYGSTRKNVIMIRLQPPP